jgi:transposase, IS30 family
MGGTWLREADRGRIWDLHSQGLNTNEIAPMVGRAYSSVATVIKATGGIRPTKPCRSTLRLSQAEREEISRGISAKETFAIIAGRIGRATSTVSREVAANGGRVQYRACRSDRAALAGARRPKTAKLKRSPRLKKEVGARLNKRWSPQQIAATLQQDFPDEPEMWISHAAIYQALFVRERCVFPADAHRLLRTGRPRRRAQRGTKHERRGKNPNMVMIADRPLEVEDRLVPGHWEGDLIMGRGPQRAIGTLVERTSRYLVLLNLVNGYSAELLNAVMSTQFDRMPALLRRSLTWDQGTEMSGHGEFTTATGIPVYFCQPRSPWERGTNENMNGLLRQYFPKGVDLGGVTQARLNAVARQLNERPRRILEWGTPADHFARFGAMSG